MAKQETPKKGTASQMDSTLQAQTRANIQKLDKEIMKGVMEGAIESLQNFNNPVSNKNQSAPGKTSGGFSYKLKND